MSKKSSNRDSAIVKPARLRKGDTIALLSPSSGLGKIFPHRVERGVEALKQLGFKVKLYPSASLWSNGSAGTVHERLSDLHSAFADEEVRAIIAVIGGLTANSLLPNIDYDLIANNPKIFVGYSDICMLHFAILKMTGLVTFHGPSIMTQFAEFPKPLSYTISDFLETLCHPVGKKKIERSEMWTEEFLDWGSKEDLTRARKLLPNLDGHKWLRAGVSSGPLLGGCIYSVHQIRGTKYELDYSGANLMLETPEGANPSIGISLGYVESQLIDLRLSGIFDQIGGLIFGRGMGYTNDERLMLEQIILEQTAGYNFPILHNVDFGHSDPVLTIPLGIQSTLDSIQGHFMIDEAGVI